METLDAMRRRASTRAYLAKPVSRATIEAVLDAARAAPSGANTQPWQVAVLTGRTKEILSAALISARTAGEKERPDYPYYPAAWTEPYKTRRKECGIAMYQALGIAAKDEVDRREAWLRNYRFFGAPAGLLFFVDRALAQGSWVDMGMFIQNVMLAATDQGLATCPQAALAEYPDVVRATLHLPDHLILVCGLSLGYADPDAPVNKYRTTREPLSAFTRWYV